MTEGAQVKAGDLLLLLWPTLWAVWIASAGRPRGDVVLVGFSEPAWADALGT